MHTHVHTNKKPHFQMIPYYSPTIASMAVSRLWNIQRKIMLWAWSRG